MIEIDGSSGEGGGQMLRSALTLALLTRHPFRLYQIRARRDKPGLRPQHRTCVEAAARIGQAEVHGAEPGSRELTFLPRKIEPGTYRFDIGTAGATSLLLHTVYLPLALRADRASEVILTGGTHVAAAPSFHFLQTTWSGYLARMGVQVAVAMVRPGFYPRGGGEIRARIEPCRAIHPLVLDGPAGEARAAVLSAVAGLPKHVGERLARRAEERLTRAGLAVTTTLEHWENGPGCVLTVTLPTVVPTVFCGVGARGKPAEAVADEVVAEALAFRASGRAVDPHSADQIILPLAFAEGRSRWTVARVTQHLLTHADIIARFHPCRIQIAGREGEPGMVEIEGRPL